MSKKGEVASISKSVDYLTVTTKTDVQSANLIYQLYELLGRGALYEADVRKWAFMGYRGQSLDGVRYGIRGSEALVMLSGARASEFWPSIAPLRHNCTRIDLAVTATLAEADDQVTARAYEQAQDNASITGTLISNTRGGTTMYLGSRHSRFFGRLYDKGAEMGLEAGMYWRWEIEVKKPASDAVVAQLLKCSDPKAWIGDYVYRWYAARGIPPMWDDTDAESAIEIEAAVSSVDKSLKWLSSQVKPTIGRLIVAGHELEVREALGLPINEKFPDWS